MAHFAQLDASGIVLRVVVIDNTEATTEAAGIARCQELFGADTQWRQTSYNASIRKNYAGIGYTYDIARDAFIAPQPYKSWVLNEASCQWQAPKEMPSDGKSYTWDEGLLRWVALS
jgi:hypothetical protein